MLGKQESYKIIARHFADTIKVRLIFEEGATPQTDGNTIVLPTEMREDLIDETLGAILHETAHIRMTDFSCISGITEDLMVCLNTLEDIRIDHATYKKYPNARGFQEALIDNVLDSKEKIEMLKKEPFPVRVLKGLILKANFYKPEDVYDEDVCKLVKDLQRFIDGSKDVSFQEVYKLSKELCKILMDKTVDKAKKDKESGGSSEDYGLDISKYISISESSNGKQQQTTQDMSDIKDQAKQFNTCVDQYNDLKRRTKLNTTRLNKLTKEHNKKINENKFKSSQEKKESQGKIDKKAKEVNQLNNDFKKITKQTKDLNNKVEELKKNIKENKQDIQELDKQKSDMAQKMFAQQPDDKVELLGFDALKGEDFTPISSPIDNLDISKSLDELIREVLVLKYEKAKTDEDGHKLNSSRLADLYTDYDNLFMEDKHEEKKTHVSFIVDASGSMDGGYCSYDANNEIHSSRDLALGALKTLCSSLKRAILSGAPADFSIHAFGCNVVPLVENYDDYKENEIESKYDKSRGKTGYGTNLSRAVTLVNEFMADKEGDDRIAIILTDACVDDRQIENLSKEAMTDQAKFMFIGLNVEQTYNQSAWDLFGDYNITEPTEALPILERSLMTLI